MEKTSSLSVRNEFSMLYKLPGAGEKIPLCTVHVKYLCSIVKTLSAVPELLWSSRIINKDATSTTNYSVTSQINLKSV